jgi:hypothetical protein
MTTVWILAALVGGALSMAGFRILWLRFRRGRIRRRYLLAWAVGYVALVSFALLEALRPAAVTGPVRLIVLLPACVAIVVIVCEHRGGNGAGRAAG